MKIMKPELEHNVKSGEPSHNATRWLLMGLDDDDRGNTPINSSVLQFDSNVIAVI